MSRIFHINDRVVFTGSINDSVSGGTYYKGSGTYYKYWYSFPYNDTHHLCMQWGNVPYNKSGSVGFRIAFSDPPFCFAQTIGNLSSYNRTKLNTVNTTHMNFDNNVGGSYKYSWNWFAIGYIAKW